MARDPEDLDMGRPDAVPDGPPEESPRTPASQRAALERTLKEGADGFRFSTLIDGVRADAERSPAPTGWTDALVDDRPRRAHAPTPVQPPRARVPAMWIGVAAVLLVLVVMQAAVLFIVAVRAPRPAPPSQPVPPAARPVATGAPLPAAAPARPSSHTETAAAHPAARAASAPRTRIEAAPRAMVRRTTIATAPRRPWRTRRVWRRRPVRRMRRSATGVRRSIPGIAGHTGAEGRANSIIDRLPQ